MNNILKRPWVIGAGVAFVGLAVVLNLARGGSSGSSDPTSTQAAYNALTTAQIGQNTQVQLASISAETKDTAALYGLLSTMETVRGQVQTAFIGSSAAVSQQDLIQQGLTTRDALDNAARTQQTWLTTGAQKYIADDQVRIAKAQAKAAQNSSLFSAIGKIGSSAALALGG